ncbi:MAG: PssE/Cps14G family polysaccharide biosynthesis glycosyltransferase [bacterium]|nr:PssE/Cps14G family polysaccharide biosynthesis glycosyltransferase [bacterium]
MILVTLGTQDKKFDRLLKAIDKQIKLGNIKDEVIVQAGYSYNYKTNNMKIFDLIPIDEFDDLIKRCDILITHGGVGSIITGLKNNKKVIAVARLKKYKEHTNNHQLQIIDNFTKEGYILSLDDFNKLGDIIKNIDSFKPKKYKSNSKKFIDLVDMEIMKYL